MSEKKYLLYTSCCHFFFLQPIAEGNFDLFKIKILKVLKRIRSFLPILHLYAISYFYTQCILNISFCKTAVRFSNWFYDPASKLQQYTVCQCRHLIFTSFFSNENLSTKFGQKEVKLIITDCSMGS